MNKLFEQELKKALLKSLKIAKIKQENDYNEEMYDSETNNEEIIPFKSWLELKEERQNELETAFFQEFWNTTELERFLKDSDYILQ
jgi:hypothetical protein